jgi:FtsP/CotA-like multicopper oxidase with cupredoxin domain
VWPVHEVQPATYRLRVLNGSNARTFRLVLLHVIDANEQGLKDTVRVNPNEIVELAIRFKAYSGRYMYHCHILEQEDRDMMRPIVIMPAQLMPFMS